MLSYDSQFPIYSLAHSQSPQDRNRLAIGSFILGGSPNVLQVLGPKRDSHQPSHLVPLASTTVGFPQTCLAWEPSPSSRTSGGSSGNSPPRELLASTGDALRIWEYTAPTEGGGPQGRMTQKTLLSHTKAVQAPTGPPTPPSGQSRVQNNPAPLTSLSWNALNPSMIVTSSVDTTCTVWDVQTGVAVTQLIAHDREVYDVAWLPGGTEVFVSVGEDGSLRAFDLRSLEHSTILYETPASSSSSSTVASSSPALMRIAFNPSDAHYLATFNGNSGDVQVLDMRSPGSPVVELKGHGRVGGRVTSLGWGEKGPSGTGGGLCTGGTDSLLLLWDAAALSTGSSSQPPPPAAAAPALAAAVSSRPGSHAGGVGSADGSKSSGSIPQRFDPLLAYTAPGEVDSISWAKGGESVACAGGTADGKGWVRSMRIRD